MTGPAQISHSGSDRFSVLDACFPDLIPRYRTSGRDSVKAYTGKIFPRRAAGGNASRGESAMERAAGDIPSTVKGFTEKAGTRPYDKNVQGNVEACRSFQS